MDSLEFHKTLTVVDGHCDTVLDLLGMPFGDKSKTPRDFFQRGRGHIDFPRLLEGGVSCQIMALYTDSELVPEAGPHTWRILEAIEGLWEQKRGFVPALKVADILAAKAAGQVAGILSIEGGEAIGGEAGGLDRLRAFHARGLRLMGLTWSRPNAIAMGVATPPEAQAPGGLTPFGRKVVKEMERLGIVVDVSHLSDQAFEEVLDLAERPLVASHSNARAICPAPRNLTDPMAERIAAAGGLIGLTFAGLFIDQVPAQVSRERFMDHLYHLLGVVGPDHLGLGSDFDGFTPAFGIAFDSCADLPWITTRLLEDGQSPKTVAKLMGGNWLRVLGQVIG